MGRSEQKMKERKAAQQRSLTPYVTPDVEPPARQGRDTRRGGGVRNRGAFELPDMLKPSVISTPQGGTRAKPQKRGAPAQPAVKPRTGGGQNLPPSAAVPGTGPDGNKVGSDADPNTPGLQGPGAPGARINANGLQQYGKTLGGLNEFTAAFTGGYQLTDIKSAFQSNDLSGAYQNGSNKLSYQETPYELPEGTQPSNVGGKFSMDGGELPTGDTGYEVLPSSVPGTVGKNASDPQEGVSDKPDIADQVRAVRMRRKGPRDEGSFRGFNIDRNNAIAQQPKAEAPDPEKIAQEQRRNKIRSTFMDLDTPIIKASVAANAVAGLGKNSDGDAMFNYGGELVQAKDGMQQQAKNAAMMGRNPTEFLDIKIKEVQEKEEDKK